MLFYIIKYFYELFSEKPSNQEQEINDTFILSSESNDDIIEPTKKQIENLVRDTIAGENEFVILNKGDNFIQYAGCQVEFAKGEDKLYQTVRYDFTPREVVNMFILFYENPIDFDNSYEWELGNL